MGNLIEENLLTVADIDPIGRRLNPYGKRQNRDTMVQIVLLSESEALQSMLRTYGLETQTVEHCKPCSISSPSALADAYSFLGKSQKLVYVFDKTSNIDLKIFLKTMRLLISKT